MYFLHYLGFWGGVAPRGSSAQPANAVSSFGSSRMVVPLPSSRCLAEGNRIFSKHFFDIVTTYNNMLCKACFSPILCVFHTIWVWGGGGGLPRGLGHNLLMQYSGLGNSKMEFSATDFFDTLTIQNDPITSQRLLDQRCKMAVASLDTQQSPQSCPLKPMA